MSNSAHSNISTDVSLSLASSKSRKTSSKLGYEEVLQEDYNEQELEALTNNQSKSVEKLQQLKTNIYEFLEERIAKILSSKAKWMISWVGGEGGKGNRKYIHSNHL